MLAGAAAGPSLLKGEKNETIGVKKKLRGWPKDCAVIDDSANFPREGDRRLLPLQGTPIRGDMMLCGTEEAPQYEVFRKGRWVPLA